MKRFLGWIEQNAARLVIADNNGITHDWKNPDFDPARRRDGDYRLYFNDACGARR